VAFCRTDQHGNRSSPDEKRCDVKRAGILGPFAGALLLCAGLTGAVRTAPACAQQTQERTLPTLSPEQEAMIKPILALGPPNAGGTISGYVEASLPGNVPSREVALPQAQVYLQTPNGDIAGKTMVETDGSGRFLLGRRTPGIYNVCGSMLGFASGCSQVQIVDHSVSLLQPLALKPVGRVLRGCVTMKDGSPAARFGRAAGTSAGTASVIVEDVSGRPVTTPRSVNLAGCYVIPDVPTGQGMSVAVGYEQATATRAMAQWPAKLDGSEATNLVLPAAPPEITSLVATLDGKEISRTEPGAIVTAAVQARSEANYPLNYAWADSTGTVIQGNGPTVQWQLPRTNSANAIYVEVTDGHGGAARAALWVPTASAELMKRVPAKLGGTAPTPGAVALPPPGPSGIPGKDPPQLHPSDDPPQSFEFINPSTLVPCDGPHPTRCFDPNATDDEASNYYRAIGVYDNNNQPQGAYASFTTWKTAWGFSDDPTQPGPNETRAVYYNNIDLQFGRDMHCLEKQVYVAGPIFFPLWYQVCYVTNFTNTTGQPLPGQDSETAIGLAFGNLYPVATVAMLAVEPASFSLQSPSVSNVAFIVFAPQKQNVGKEGPNAEDQFVPSRAAVLDKPDGSLSDNNGTPKAVPGVCMTCHGGNYDPQKNTVDDARFLPFDTHSFVYGTPFFYIKSEAGQFTEGGQGEAFRKLNAIVRDADVSSSNPVTSSAITDMIDGWYQWCGGFATPGCHIDEVNHLFIPGSSPNPGGPPISCVSNSDPVTCGWADNSYREIAYQFFPRNVCRTCHLANADRFNWQNYNNVIAGGGYGSICGYLSGSGSPAMPFAQVPFNNFWSNASMRNVASEVVNCQPPLQ
jgi:hypothetical protein